MMSQQAVVQGSLSSWPVHQTALHRAAMVGNSEALAALIQGGCALDLQDRDGNTALHELSWHGFAHCVKLLLKAGADLHTRNKAGNTALHLACQNAHTQTARLLLLGGATPESKNNVGDTCLHVAARYNNLTIVKMLLSSLCPVMDKNQAGDTALHVAAALNHKRTVQLLLEAGTDGTTRNNAGKTALDKARDNKHKEVALLLARTPQVHRFMRGRTIKKRRERLATERTTQSMTRVEIQTKPDSGSVEEETPSSDQTSTGTMGCHQQQKQQQHYHKIPVISRSPHQTRRTLKEQAPAYSCHCQPLLKKFEGKLKVTQEEMRLDIINIQDQVNRRLAKMDRRNRHQIKVLDMLNQERTTAERKIMTYKIEQRLAQGREEALMTQAAVSHELKRWRMSQVNDMNIHIPTKAQYSKLLPSPSVEQTVADPDLESLPLLSVVSGDSSSSLATYVNILPFEPIHSLEGQDEERLGSRTYFEMRVNRSPDDYENTTLFPLPTEHTSDPLGSVDPIWQPRVVHYSSTVVPLCVAGLSSSSSQSSVSKWAPQEFSYSKKSMKNDGELNSFQKHTGLYSEGARALEFFIDRPVDLTFSQEKNNLHAKEVTQRFFETVTTQLERWYERKILEMEQEVDFREKQDQEKLLQRISILEEELQRLKTNELIHPGSQ